MKAMEMIEDGDIIYLDSGTTTLELAKCMNQQVIVITNDAMIAAELINHKSVTLYCTGGQLQRGNDSYIYVGPNVNQVIAKYHTNKCFMGCSALNFNYGLMVFSEIEAEIKQAIVKNTGKIICLADSSKFDRTAFRSFLALEDMDVCVTDQNVLQSHIELLQARNIEVEIANV
jgi:DeoR family fructose operon transcriptional repressor